MRENPSIGETVGNPTQGNLKNKKATFSTPSPDQHPSISEAGRERTFASRDPEGQERDKPQKEPASKYVKSGQKITVTVYAHDEKGLIGNWGNYCVYIPSEEIEEGFLPNPSQLKAYMHNHHTLEVQVKEFTYDFRKDIIASRKALLTKEEILTPIPSMPRQPKKISKDQVTAPKEIKGEGFPVQVDADEELPSELKNIANGEEFNVICNGFRESGLTAEWNGYSVFIPDTEIATSYVYNLSAYKGDPLCLRALRIYYTENRKEIIASRRKVLEQKKVTLPSSPRFESSSGRALSGNPKKKYISLKKGQVVEGEVIAFEQGQVECLLSGCFFSEGGAYIKLNNGRTGFLPYSSVPILDDDYSDIVTHHLRKGDMIFVKVVSSSFLGGDIKLSVSALPVKIKRKTLFSMLYHKGDIIQGVVRNVSQQQVAILFEAIFYESHMGSLSTARLFEEPFRLTTTGTADAFSKVVSKGNEVSCRILDLDYENLTMRLNIIH